METAVKIIRFLQIRDTKAGKISDVQVKGLSTGQEFKVSVFLEGAEEIGFGTEESVLMDLKTGSYKGQTQYSTSIRKIKPLDKNTVVNEPVPEEQPKQVVDNSVWIKKDRGISWLACVNASVRMVEMSLNSKPEKETLLETEVMGLCLNVAELLYEAWLTKKEDAPDEVEDTLPNNDAPPFVEE